jgi:hypothetical protein
MLAGMLVRLPWGQMSPLAPPDGLAEQEVFPATGDFLERIRFHHNCELISQLLRSLAGGLTKVMSRQNRQKA